MTELTPMAQNGNLPVRKHVSMTAGEQTVHQKLLRLSKLTIFPFEDLASAPHLLCGLLGQVSGHY